MSLSFVILLLLLSFSLVFFFNDTATTEIYTLSLHDALPIYGARAALRPSERRLFDLAVEVALVQTLEHSNQRYFDGEIERSEEHTSELQSRQYLVCRLLLEKKKQKK